MKINFFINCQWNWIRWKSSAAEHITAVSCSLSSSTLLLFRSNPFPDPDRIQWKRRLRRRGLSDRPPPAPATHHPSPPVLAPSSIAYRPSSTTLTPPAPTLIGLYGVPPPPLPSPPHRRLSRLTPSPGPISNPTSQPSPSRSRDSRTSGTMPLRSRRLVLRSVDLDRRLLLVYGRSHRCFSRRTLRSRRVRLSGLLARSHRRLMRTLRCRSGSRSTWMLWKCIL